VGFTWNWFLLITLAVYNLFSFFYVNEKKFCKSSKNIFLTKCAKYANMHLIFILENRHLTKISILDQKDFWPKFVFLSSIFLPKFQFWKPALFWPNFLLGSIFYEKFWSLYRFWPKFYQNYNFGPKVLLFTKVLFEPQIRILIF